MRPIDRIGRPDPRQARDEATPETLRAELAQLLDQAQELAQQLEERRLERGTGRGYFTHTARAEMDALIVNERRSHTKVDPKIAGLNLTAHASTRTGPTRPPANLKTMSAGIDLCSTLRYVHWLAFCRLYDQRMVHARPPRGDADSATFAAATAQLLPYFDHPRDLKFLRGLVDDVRDAIEKAGVAIHGETQTGIDAPCPWCERQTLVMFWARPTNSVERNYATCDRDARGHLHPCTCRNDPLCPCKVQPVTYRHQWINRPGENGRGTLGWLKKRIEADRRTRRTTNLRGTA